MGNLFTRPTKSPKEGKEQQQLIPLEAMDFSSTTGLMQSLKRYAIAPLNALAEELPKLASSHVDNPNYTFRKLPDMLKRYKGLSKAIQAISVKGHAMGLEIQVIHAMVVRRLQKGVGDFPTVASCYKGYSDQHGEDDGKNLFYLKSLIDTLTKFHEQVSKVKMEFADFNEDFKEKKGCYCAKITRVVGSLGILGVAAGVAVVIILHCIPGVNVVLGAGLLGGAIAVGTVAMVGGIARLAKKSHVEQVEDNLAKVEKALGEIIVGAEKCKATAENLKMLQPSERIEAIETAKDLGDAGANLAKVCEKLIVED